MAEVNLKKGDEVYARSIVNNRQVVEKVKVMEVVGRGAFCRFGNDPNKERMLLWSKMSTGPKGPWGKKAFVTNGKPKTKGARRKVRSEALEVKEAPKVPNSAKQKLTPMEKMATDLVGKVVRLDEDDIARVSITPDLAARWLDKSEKAKKNRRKVRANDVEKYMRLMVDGLWSSRTSDPIQIDKEGYMVNGQHRFWAVVLTEKTIDMRVIFGVTEAEEKYATDGGAVRTAAVSLGLKSRHVAVINAIRRHSTGARGRLKATNHEIEKLYEFYKPHIEWFDNIPGTAAGKSVTRPSDIAAVLIRAKSCGEDTNLLTAFVQALRRDMFSPGLETLVNSDRLMMVNKLAHLLKTVKTSSDQDRNERTSKTEWVLQRFIENRSFTRVCSNQEKIWPCPLLSNL